MSLGESFNPFFKPNILNDGVFRNEGKTFELPQGNPLFNQESDDTSIYQNLFNYNFMQESLDFDMLLGQPMFQMVINFMLDKLTSTGMNQQFKNPFSMDNFFNEFFQRRESTQPYRGYNYGETLEEGIPRNELNELPQSQVDRITRGWINPNVSTDKPSSYKILNKIQMNNAKVIASVVIDECQKNGKTPEETNKAVRIALATALTESSLINKNHGYDDSKGLFQQRPSQGWGTAEQVQDPIYATRKFIQALLKTDYMNMSVSEAAQNVQKSGLPDAYAEYENMATDLANDLLTDVDEPSGEIYGTRIGKSLAKRARYFATDADLGYKKDKYGHWVPRGHDGGDCYNAVKRSIKELTGVQLTGESAYDAARQLAKRPDKFKEVTVSKGELRNLPAGAIVVWHKGPKHEHGHISVASGNGKEYSDKVRNQITEYGTSYRVFIPIDTSEFGTA